MAFKEAYFTIPGISGQADEMFQELRKGGLRTHPWNYSPKATALMVTDMQHYFLDPGSHAYVPSAPAILRNILSLVTVFKFKRLPVIMTRHINDKTNAGNMGKWWADLIEEGSDHSDIITDLQGVADHVIIKSQYDAFYETGLAEILKAKSIKSLVITGVMTNLCCETTVRSAFVRGLAPVLPIDSTATYSRQMHLSTFRNLGFGFSPLMTTADVIKKFVR